MALKEISGRRFHCSLLLLFLGALPCTSLLQAETFPPADVDKVWTLATGQTQDEFPTIGCDDQGDLWVSWVSWDGRTDSVLARKLDNAENTTAVTLTVASGDHWRPAMGTDGQGRLWATWAQNDDGVWNIHARFLQNNRWSQPIRLTEGEANSFSQELARDSAGQLWMAWQSIVDGHYDVLLARLSPDGLGDVINLSRHPASDWEPAITATNDGRLFVAWDSYRNGSYDILLSEIRDGEAGPPLGVATTDAYEAHAALAVDTDNRLWIAWDNGGSDWGRNNASGRRLHSERAVEIACIADGRLCKPAQTPDQVLTGPMRRFCELPALTVDGDGRLWLFVRHLTDLTPERKPGGRRPQARGIWNPYALCYTNGQWSHPVALENSNGRNDMRVATCLDDKGHVWAAWADDGRKPTRAEEPVNHSVHATRFKPPAGQHDTLPVRPLDREVQPASTLPRQEKRYSTIQTADRRYRLLYGDTHRHTDISRCGMNYDGSLLDTYRYAIDVAQLDFLAISDHDQDILKHRYGRPKSPIQHYAWWRSEKYCDLLHIPGHFIPIYAYEHGGGFRDRGGHKNVLYLERGNPCIEDDRPEALFAALEGRTAVAIPHQLADGPSAVEWREWNPVFERVAEIFQARGSYEYWGATPLVRVERKGNYYQDALAMGVRIGVIASSDHGMVSNAYAGVYCADVSREAIFEGLKDRRTFGATDKIELEFRLGDHLQGREIQIAESPKFKAHVRGTAPLTTVQIVSDGRFIYTTNPQTSDYRFQFTDLDLKPGDSAYYYLRCEQENRQYGWSSPIWVQYTR